MTRDASSIPKLPVRGPRQVRADDIVMEVGRLMEGSTVADVYRNRVLSDRTRRYELNLAKAPASVEILHTLLGIELKIGQRRLLCPDLATARFLQVFARIGVAAVAIPYDITQVSRVADELESAWHRAMLLAEHASTGRSDRLKSRVQRAIANDLRVAVTTLGAGSKRPVFLQSTRQRVPGGSKVD